MRDMKIFAHNTLSIDFVLYINNYYDLNKMKFLSYFSENG